MKIARLAILVTVMLMAAGCVGGMNDACIKIVPVVAQGNGLINEAQDALIQADVAVRLITDTAHRAKAMEAVAEARSSLRVAEAMLNSASEACSQPDLKGIFRVFADAWEVVRTYLSTFGGSGVQNVDDPSAYIIGKKAQ